MFNSVKVEVGRGVKIKYYETKSQPWGKMVLLGYPQVVNDVFLLFQGNSLTSIQTLIFQNALNKIYFFKLCKKAPYVNKIKMS